MSAGLTLADALGALLAIAAIVAVLWPDSWLPNRQGRSFGDTLPSPPPRQFQVMVQDADGRQRQYICRGGTSWEHVQHAQEEAGLGSVVRVRPLPEPPPSTVRREAPAIPRAVLLPVGLAALVVLAVLTAGCASHPRGPSAAVWASCPPLTQPKRTDEEAQARRITELETWYTHCRNAALAER